MAQWYRIVLESDDPVQAEAQASSLEHALTRALEPVHRATSAEVYYDWLAKGRGRVFWLSEAAFDGARSLAERYGAEPYPGLVDMRFLVPLFD